jgi:hypothetical protein
MRRILLGLGGIFLLAGCAGNELLLTGHQGSLTHVGHWERMAENSAIEIDGCLLGKMRPLDFFAQLKKDTKDLLPPRGVGGNSAGYDNGEENESASDGAIPYCWADTTGLSGRKIFVAVGDRSTGFGRNFRKFLMAELANLGHDVTGDPANAVVVRFHLDAVVRNGQLPNSVPGFFSLAAFTSWIFKGDEEILRIFPTKFALLGAPVAAGLMADSFVAHEIGGPQLVVTTSLLDGSRMLMTNADGYFVSDEDLVQYVGPLGPLPETPVDQIATAPGVVTLRVVEE